MTWKIEEFTVTPEQAKIEAMRSMFSFSSRGRAVPAGTYRRLSRDGKTIMSDTPDELSDLAEFRWRARGRVLINGLGLGCAVKIALGKPNVRDVTVVEIDREVIDLVRPTLPQDGRLQIWCDDALRWKALPGEEWDVVWHDIWDDICAENLIEMGRLHRRYGRRCGWQGSWCRSECRRAAGRSAKLYRRVG